MDVTELMGDLMGPPDPSEKPSLDELAHFGKKGMKWGVRKERRLQRAQRVAKGQGSFTDNIRVANRELSPLAVVRNKGAQGAIERRAQQLELRKARIQKGEATTRDYLALHGGDLYNFGGKAR